MIGKKLKLIFFLILFTLSIKCIHAVNISSSVDKTQLTINDSLEYKITITGAQSAINIDETFLKDFLIISRSSSQSFKLINNEFSASQIKTFLLRPQRTGIITIPRAKINVEGKSLETTEIKITVKEFQQQQQQKQQNQTSNVTKTQSSQLNNQINTQISNQTNSDLFIIANTNKKEAYIGEEIIYNVNLFRRYSTIDKLFYQEPKFQVISEKLERNQNTYTKRYQNKNYYVQEISKNALFFYENGDIIIPEAISEIQISFFYGSQVIKSNPINLKILPLPEENKPETFSGLVGEFAITSKINTSVPVENKPIPIRIKISGDGNLKQISELAYQQNDNFKIYQSSTSDQITYVNSVKGSRTFEYIVVPKVSGKLIFPEFKFSYFSPKTKSYVSLSTKPVEIDVLKSNQVNTSATNSIASIKQLKEDLRYIKPITLNSKSNSKILTRLISTLLVLYDAILFILIVFLLTKNLRFISSLSEKFKVKSDKKAFKALNELEKAPSDNDIHLLQNILYNYLSSIIKHPSQSLAQHDLFEKLTSLNVADNNLTDLKNLLDKLAFISYSQNQNQALPIKELIQETKDIIKRIQNEK